jgi:hypothetical protein
MNLLQMVTLLKIGGGGATAPDTTAPTVVITSSASNPTATLPIPITITFSEVVTGFTVGDLTVVNATASDFAGSGAVYTANLYPTPNAAVTVDIGAGVCVDGAGNGNAAATQFAITSNAFALAVEFATDDDNPLTSPHANDPTGTITIGDASGFLSIAGGQLVIADGAGNWSSTGWYGSAAVTRAAGIALIASIDLTGGHQNRIFQFGFNNTGAVTNPNRHSFYVNDGNLYSNDNDGTNVSNYTLVTGTYRIAIVLSSVGAKYLIKGGAYTEWTLLFVGTIGNTATLYPLMTILDGAFKVNYVRRITLPAPFNTDLGLATDSKASASANDVINHTASSTIKFKWQAVTNDVLNLMVRRVSDTSCMVVRCDQAGSTIKLIKVDTTETELQSAAQTWTNGTSYTITVHLNGDIIRVYTETTDITLKLNQTNTFNNTATTAKVDKAGTNFAAYPKTLPAAAITIMDNCTNP